MRRSGWMVAALGVALVPALAAAQDDASRSVTDGGIKVEGWQGKIDAREASNGMKLTDAKLTKTGDTFMVMTGPAVTYWNPANRATGSYTISATFSEPKFMNLNNHAHPYGIVIGGNDLGTDSETYYYCSAYGNGRFIVRGFGPAAFQLNGRGAAHDAVNRAPGQNQPVTQMIAVTVTADKVECAINGTVVSSLAKSDVVGAGKLKSTDGVYGMRFGHNTDVTVSGLKMERK